MMMKLEIRVTNLIKSRPLTSIVVMVSVLLGTFNAYSAVAMVDDLNNSILAMSERDTFFDIPFLTDPLVIGFKTSLFGGLLSDPSITQVIEASQYVKVNYSQPMAALLLPQSYVPLSIGVLVGTALSIFIFGGVAARFLRAFYSKQAKQGEEKK